MDIAKAVDEQALSATLGTTLSALICDLSIEFTPLFALTA